MIDTEIEITWDSLADDEKNFIINYRKLSEEDKKLVKIKINDYTNLHNEK